MNLSSRNLLGAVALLSLVTTVACGTSDTGSGRPGGTYSSGLPGNESLANLSDADQASFCQSATKYLTQGPEAGDLACSGAGIGAAYLAEFMNRSATDADLQKACSDAVTQCKNRPASTADAGAGVTATCGKPTSACTTTVAQMEACINDEAAAFSAAASSIPSCSSLTAASLNMRPEGGTGTTIAPPTTNSIPSCKMAYDNCPMTQPGMSGISDGGAAG